MSNWIIRGFFGGLGAASVVALAATTGCRKGTALGAQTPPPPIVNTALAVAQNVPAYLDEIGKTNAVENVTIMPQVAGRIDALHFVDGADLKKGQLLFTLDARPFVAARDQAEAQLLKDQAASENADRFLNRQADIYKQGFVSPSDYDTAVFNAKAAKAALEADRAAIESAKLNVEYCTIEAPFDGRGGMRLVDPGNIVKINETPLLVIQRLDPIYADFTINESNLTDVRSHMADHTLVTQVKLPTDRGPGATGELTFLDNAVQDASGTIKLRATLANKNRHFWPGQYVKVRLVVQVMKDAVIVPQSAPQLSQQGSYVYVVKADSTAELRPVVLGQQQANNSVVVLSGVKAGERVITNGQLLVFPGGPVNVQPAAVAATQNATADDSEEAPPGTEDAPAATQPVTSPATLPSTQPAQTASGGKS